MISTNKNHLFLMETFATNVINSMSLSNLRSKSRYVRGTTQKDVDTQYS